MYCIGCGADNVEGTAHCIRCGHSLATLRTDQYQTPTIDGTSPTLWNPDVAAMLSIFLTPIFGAIIHALNWRRLGQSRRAVTAWLWSLVITAVFLSIVCIGAIMHIGEQAIGAYLRLAQLLTLLIWYFGTGRAQGKHIASQLRNEYFRESWFAPVFVALALICAALALAAIGLQ